MFRNVGEKIVGTKGGREGKKMGWERKWNSKRLVWENNWIADRWLTNTEKP